MNSKPPIPKEHGSWAMLTVPLLLGVAIAPSWHWRVIILLVAALGFFLLQAGPRGQPGFQGNGLRHQAAASVTCR